MFGETIVLSMRSVVVDAHIKTLFAYLSTPFVYFNWLITKKRQTSRALLDIPPKAAHALYSVNIACA